MDTKNKSQAKVVIKYEHSFRSNEHIWNNRKKTGNHITSMEETPEIITRNAEEKAKHIKIDNAWDSKANPTYRSLAFLN